MLPIGVIEGFYGKSWSWDERQRMVRFLAENRFNTYWYAPKSDVYLRKNWALNWNNEDFQQLRKLSQYCLEHGIQFGIGLSPLALYDEWRDTGKAKLLERLKQIADLQPSGLALLFDDMQGDLPELASIQCEIAHTVRDNITVEQLIVCPSYYSFDPILEELFGNMPKNYWHELGDKLDKNIDLFWTGDKVISSEYPEKSLQKITTAFQRKPVIWDNSIVNDGRKTSPFLNIQAMFPLSDIKNNIKSLIVNPMNAAGLSEICLLSLQLEGSEKQRLFAAINLCAPALKESLLANLHLFKEMGRDNLSVTETQHIDQLFREQSHAVAQNIISWLEGEYQFNPECLT